MIVVDEEVLVKSCQLFERRCTTLAICFVVALTTTFGRTASACDDLTVRDAAFQEARDIHRLCVMGTSGDSATQDIYDGLEGWLAVEGAKLNVELMRVNVDAAEVDWKEYGIPSAPPSAPAVVFAGHHTADSRTFFVDVWEPGPDADALELIRTSPARQAIAAAVLRHIAVLLYVPGSDDSADKTDKILENVAATWSEKSALGLSIVRVDRNDPAERVLLSFIGVHGEGPDWTGIVFGPGKLMAPLIGNDISEAALNDQIVSLTAACTCLQTPSRLGVDLPMAWDESFNTSLVALATENDESDVVAIGVAGVLPPGAEPFSSVMNRSALAPTLWAVGVLGLASIVATVAVFWRKNKRSPAPIKS